MTVVVQFGKNMYHLQSSMESWCTKHIGINPPYKNWVHDQPKTWEGLGTWCMSSMFGNTFFYFKEKKDAEWFVLRWQ